MDVAKVYRNIDRRQEWFGVEIVDAFGLATLIWVLLVFLPPRALGWDLLVVGLAWLAIRLFKRGKPSGYTTALVRFYLVRPNKCLSAAALDRELPSHPFAITNDQAVPR